MQDEEEHVPRPQSCKVRQSLLTKEKASHMSPAEAALCNHCQSVVVRATAKLWTDLANSGPVQVAT